ncbi:hypothetical protein B0A48_13154 [Cryoendolithus antarcticus]|uniref:Major facilitator superfamily (MFS) profile domain-containing protein n=1 Tax=Cryoendolithus antarcticus TaxID=1507870 RepID=A0A1V8SNM9_9PEZI|nr:hypothetical protein B0A48_13154 [Cryoendolithus antarcticus]
MDIGCDAFVLAAESMAEAEMAVSSHSDESGSMTEKETLPEAHQAGSTPHPVDHKSHLIGDNLPRDVAHTVKDVAQTDGSIKQYKVITFDNDDSADPKIWSKRKKWIVTLSISVVCFCPAFLSAVVTPGIAAVAVGLRVPAEVALLTVTLFVVGFGVGPLVFSPLMAKNIATLLACRAIDGIAFSVPLANVGGSLSDMWRPEERGVPMAAFSVAPFLGPVLGPVVGGFVVDNVSWRWLYWLQVILSGTIFIGLFFLVPETYAPTILKKRASKLRKSTGDATYVTAQEIDGRTFGERLRVTLLLPLRLLFTEPIVTFLALYAALLYGLLYMFFVSYPIVFTEHKRWSNSKTGLMFIPIAIGMLGGVSITPLINRHYLSMRAKIKGPVPPELRLVPMILSAPLIPVGMFVFAWTSYPHLSWAGPALAGLPLGFGFVILYNAFLN